MTKREEYDSLAAALKEYWKEVTEHASEKEEMLRQLKTEIEDDGVSQ